MKRDSTVVLERASGYVQFGGLVRKEHGVSGIGKELAVGQVERAVIVELDCTTVRARTGTRRAAGERETLDGCCAIRRQRHIHQSEGAVASNSHHLRTGAGDGDILINEKAGTGQRNSMRVAI